MPPAKKQFTLVEFGTSKICVLHGTAGHNNVPEIISFAEKHAEGSVLRGAVADYNAALKTLIEVHNNADKAASVKLHDRRSYFYLINGASVISRRGEATVYISASDRKVRREHIADAIQKARSLTPPPELHDFDSCDSFFLLDGAQEVWNPVGMIAEKLTAVLHIMAAPRKRVDQINAVFHELGLEQTPAPVFSPLASAFGALSPEEQSAGVLLLDFGAGCLDFLVVHHEGVLLSGVLPVGLDNLANDLSVGLDLPFDFCKNFIRENRLDALRERGMNALEYPAASSKDRLRRIPLDSFEKIMDLRLRETFRIIREQLESKNLIRKLSKGVVLTGGAANLPAAIELLRQEFSLPVRTGEPLGISGVKPDFQQAPSCYSALLGLLKYAVSFESDSLSEANGLRGTLANVTDSMVSTFRNVQRVFKK